VVEGRGAEVLCYSVFGTDEGVGAFEVDVGSDCLETAVVRA